MASFFDEEESLATSSFDVEGERVSTDAADQVEIISVGSSRH